VAAFGGESYLAVLAVVGVGPAFDEPVAFELEQHRGAAGGREVSFQGEHRLRDAVVCAEKEQQRE
jgi:hypothetical protein